MYVHNLNDKTVQAHNKNTLDLSFSSSKYFHFFLKNENLLHEIKVQCKKLH